MIFDNFAMIFNLSFGQQSRSECEQNEQNPAIKII